MDLIYSLRILALVARHNGFAAAARHLNVSTSTIMRAMDTLEMRVGSTLLVRSTRHVDLTETGYRMLSGASPILDDIAGLLQELSDNETSLRGQIRVTAALSFGRTILVPMAREFTQQHPNAAIDFMLSDSLIDISQHNIDVAIRLADPLDSLDLVAHELCPMKRLVIASPDYLKHHGQLRRPKDLEKHNCLLFRPTLQDHPWAAISDTWTFVGKRTTSSVEVSGTLSSNDADSIVMAARDGMGIAMMPDWLISHDVASGRLVRVLSGFEAVWRSKPKSLHIAYPQHRRRSRKVQAFVNHIRDRFDQMTDR